MNKVKPTFFGLGCSQSVLDGTEHIAEDMHMPIPTSYDLSLAMPPVKDQGHTETCVCQSLTSCMDFFTNEINGTPNKVNGFSVNELYNIRSNKPHDGMQIKEALHYLRHTGMLGQKINTYSLVKHPEILKQCIVAFGPCVAGFPVYSDSSIYFWQPKGYMIGGHCVTITGYNENGFIIRNSWGAHWANKGHV